MVVLKAPVSKTLGIIIFACLKKKLSSYSFRPKLYVVLGKKNCLKLYVVLLYQCNINVTFPIITLTIY